MELPRVTRRTDPAAEQPVHRCRLYASVDHRALSMTTAKRIANCHATCRPAARVITI